MKILLLIIFMILIYYVNAYNTFTVEYENSIHKLENDIQQLNDMNMKQNAFIQYQNQRMENQQLKYEESLKIVDFEKLDEKLLSYKSITETLEEKEERNQTMEDNISNLQDKYDSIMEEYDEKNKSNDELLESLSEKDKDLNQKIKTLQKNIEEMKMTIMEDEKNKENIEKNNTFFNSLHDFKSQYIDGNEKIIGTTAGAGALGVLLYNLTKKSNDTTSRSQEIGPSMSKSMSKLTDSFTDGRQSNSGTNTSSTSQRSSSKEQFVDLKKSADSEKKSVPLKSAVQPNYHPEQFDEQLEKLFSNEQLKNLYKQTGFTPEEIEVFENYLNKDSTSQSTGSSDENFSNKKLKQYLNKSIDPDEEAKRIADYIIRKDGETSEQRDKLIKRIAEQLQSSSSTRQSNNDVNVSNRDISTNSNTSIPTNKTSAQKKSQQRKSNQKQSRIVRPTGFLDAIRSPGKELKPVSKRKVNVKPPVAKITFLDDIKAGEANKMLKPASKRKLNVKPPVRQKTKGEIAMDAIIERGIAMNNPSNSKSGSSSGSGSSDWS